MRPLRWLAALAAAALAIAPLRAADARPYTVEDHLGREGLGRAALSADGRWLVWERHAAYGTGARFDYDRFNDLFRTRLEVTDLAGPLGRRPLWPVEPGAGYALGPLSPDGGRAAVLRLRDGLWRLGLADLPSAAVRWLEVSPDLSESGETLLWRTPDELLVIATGPDRPPFALRWARPQAELPGRWALAAAGGASPTVYGSGRYIALRPRDPPLRLLRIDARSGETHELLHGDFVDMALAPGGRTLALFEAGADIPLAADAPVQGEAGVATRRLHLRLLDLDSGDMRPAAQGWDLLAHLLAWSPAGEELLVFGRRDRTWRDGRLLRVSIGAGAAVPLPTPGLDLFDRRRPEAVRAAWLDGEPLLWARDRAGRADWRRWTGSGWRTLTANLTTPTSAALVSGGRLLTLADGTAWTLTRDGSATPQAERIAPLAAGPAGIPRRADLSIPPGGALELVQETGTERTLLRARPGGVRAVARLAPDEMARVVGDGGALLVRTRGGGQKTLVWADSADGRRPLLALNRHLADVEAPRLCPIPHTGPDGQALTSWLALPAGTRGPAPLVVWPYPGRVYRAAPAALDPRKATQLATPLLLAGHGYAVLLPSLPARPSADGPAESLADRILAVVDAAAAADCARGRVDAARVGLWGHSFGGFAALTVATQTDRFSAIVAAAAPADLASLHGAFGPNRRLSPERGLATPWTAGWVESLQGGMKAPPWTVSGRYLRNSPLFAAGRIETPLLIAHGELDGFPLEQAESMFSALYRQGKDAQLITYWGEGHTLHAPGAIADLHRRAFAFLDAHLGLSAGAPPQRRGSGSASGAPRPRRRRPGGARRPRRRAAGARA